MERNGLHNKLPTTDRTRCRLESFLPDAGLAGPSSLVKCPRDYNPDYSLPSREEGGLFVSPAHSRMRLSYGLFRRTSGLNTSRFGEAAFDTAIDLRTKRLQDTSAWPSLLTTLQQLADDDTF